MIPVAGIAASKGKETAQALKNDVYVRRWTSVYGKGKKAKVVEHELHVNPTGILTGVAAGVAAAGAAVLGGALALRFSGKKLVTDAVDNWFMVDDFGQEIIGYDTIIDSPATEGYYTTTITYIRGVPKEVTYWVAGTPAVTHQEPIYSPFVAVVMTKRGIPFGVFKGVDATSQAVQRALKRHPQAVEGSLEAVGSHVIKAVNPITRKQQECRRWNYRFKAPGLALEDKEDESWVSKIFGV